MMSMKHGHANDSTHKMEVAQMIRIDARVCIDLKGVDIVTRILKQPIVRVQHLMTEKVKPFAGNSAVIEAILAPKFDHKPLLEIFGPHLDDETIAFFEDLLSTHLKSTMSGLRLLRREFLTKKLDLGHQITFIFGQDLVVQIVIVRGHGRGSGRRIGAAITRSSDISDGRRRRRRRRCICRGTRCGGCRGS